MPIELPGARVPDIPTLPVMVPVPPSMAPACTPTLLVRLPFTVKVPPLLTKVKPV